MSTKTKALLEADTMLGIKKKEQEEKKTVDLEDEVKFSWGRVVKRGLQNMKDDVDPIYKGAKMGVYALHGIPTWRREYLDGKLENDSHGWATVSGLFVGGASATAYYLGMKEAIEAYGPQGYAVLAIPLAAQGLSYTREAFRRARKTELSNVVMTRMKKAIDRTGTQGYDLSCEQMIERVAQRLYEENQSGKDGTTKEQRIAKNRAEAKEYLMDLAQDTFDGLFADGDVGKKYELSEDLFVGPVKRNMDRNDGDYYGSKHKSGQHDPLTKIIKETVEAKGGSANIELLGTLTAVYSTKDDRMHYEVKPNNLWNK